MITRTVRLYNFLIDSLVYLGIVFALVIPLSTVFAPNDARWVMVGVYYFYYFIMESLMGQTVGKMITKTKVVNSNNGGVSMGLIVLRTLLRIIPLDFLSYLFTPQGLHDYLSQTKLIKR